MKIHNYLITLMALFAILVASAMEEKKGTKRIAQEEEITLAEPEVGQEIEAIESEPPSKVSKTETSAVPGRLPLEQLPAELQAMIIKALESVPLSTTEPA